MPPISEIQPSYDAQDFAWFFFGNIANDSGPNEDKTRGACKKVGYSFCLTMMLLRFNTPNTEEKARLREARFGAGISNQAARDSTKLSERAKRYVR